MEEVTVQTTSCSRVQCQVLTTRPCCLLQFLGEPIWPGGKALGCLADRPRSHSASSRLSFQKRFMDTVKRPKLAWFEYVTRHNNLSKAILQDTLEGGRRRGRQRECWMDIIKEWTSLPKPELLTRASCRKESLLSHPSCPSEDPIGQGTELN